MDIPKTEQNGNYWFNNTGQELVTLQHGTSEGQLARILKNGFEPMKMDLKQTIRTVLEDFLPIAQVTAQLVDEVLSHHRHAKLRDNQNDDGRTLFACLAPSDSAQQYACLNAENGGEFANEVHSILKYELGFNDLPPRYAGARPVLIEFDAPRSLIDGNVPDASKIAQYEELGYSSFKDLCGLIGNAELCVTDATAATIKSVTFAARVGNEWTFAGQPALPPEQALGEMQEKFKLAPQENAASKLVSSIEQWAGRDIKDISVGDQALALMSLSAQNIIEGLVSKESIAAEIGDIGKNMKKLIENDPQGAANFCCSLLNHPKLEALSDFAGQAYKDSMNALKKMDPEGAISSAKIHMEVYGGIAVVATVAAGIAAATHKSPAVSLARGMRNGVS